MGKAEKNHFSVTFVLLDMEMKWTASHMNARGQGHFRAVIPWTSDMAIFTNIVSNIVSATSLVHVSGKHLQDQWSSGLLFLLVKHRLRVLYWGSSSM